MIRRRKHRGHRLTALFTWQDGTETIPDQDHDNPRLSPCTTCHATIGQPCTRPSRRHGRQNITGYHHTRTTPQEQT